MSSHRKTTGSKLVRSALRALTILHGMPLDASELYYSVDFNSPLNQTGQPPATGTGWQTPSSIVFGSQVAEARRKAK